MFVSGGALTDRDEAVYVERSCDGEAVSHLLKMDYLQVIEPRQQGKTSLGNRLQRDKRLSRMLFVSIGAATMPRGTEEEWYQGLCRRILKQTTASLREPRLARIRIPSRCDEWREFLSRVASAADRKSRQICVILDEIGAADFPGSTEFFSSLKEVYDCRQIEPEFWQLTFVLMGSFDPHELVKDDRVSPFNVAQRVRIPDFSRAQVHELVRKGRWPTERAAAIAERISHWTDGQPYLTQLICSKLDSDACPQSVDGVADEVWRQDQGHVASIMKRLAAADKLRRYLAGLKTGAPILFSPAQDPRHAQLELIGILKAVADGHCIIRNRIYEEALKCLRADESERLQRRALVFISYSHQDRRHLEALQKHLAPFKRKKSLSIWVDTDIRPGTKWKEEIREAIDGARVAVLLVSADYIASDFVARHELPRLLDSARKKGLRVLWVPVSAIGFEKTGIAKYQAAISPARPLNRMKVADRELAWVTIAQKIKEAAVAASVP